MKAPSKVKSPKQPTVQKKKLSISETDLKEMSLEVLMRLHRQAGKLIAERAEPLMENDISLSYNVQLRSKDGVVYEDRGEVKIPSITHPRLVGQAPERFEHEFMQQLFYPVNAALYDIIDTNSTTYNSIAELPDNGISRTTPTFAGLPGD